MYPFLEKGVLFWMILISVASTVDTIHPLPVISLLLALTISALAQAFPKKRLSSVCLGGYFLLCSCYPPILLTMPLLLYDAIRAKKWYLSLFAVGALLHLATFSLLQICLFCGLIPLSIVPSDDHSCWQQYPEPVWLDSQIITTMSISLNLYNFVLSFLYSKYIRQNYPNLPILCLYLFPTPKIEKNYYSANPMCGGSPPLQLIT